jgi:hypothetical protein
MPEPKYLLQRDGEGWIAAAPGYLDLSDGPVGRGKTPGEAIEALMQRPEFQLWLRENGYPNPTRDDFEIERNARAQLAFIDARNRLHRPNPSSEET